MSTDATVANCPRCLELEKRVAELEAQVKSLSVNLGDAVRSSKRQAAPFSKPESKRKPRSEHKKSGRAEGHAPASRPEPKQIDRELTASVAECPDCHSALTDITHHVQYQTDLPPVVPVVTKFTVEVGLCPVCGKRIQGSHPEQTSQALGAANHSLGANAVAIAAQMKYQFGIPFRKICRFFNKIFSLDCSPGGLVQATQRLATKNSSLDWLIQWQLSKSKVVHADETGWRLQGERRYLHGFSNEDLVLYRVGDRSNDVAQAVLGTDFGGVVCCDGYVGYDHFATARCNAHPIRKLTDLIEAGVEKTPQLVEIRDLLRAGIHLSKQRSTLAPETYAEMTWDHQLKLHEWIESHTSDSCDNVRRMACHLRRYESEFTLYLFDPAIPPTNNQAERTLRPAVLLRKVGCCNRSERGVRTFEILSSVLATAEKRGLDFIAWTKELLVGQAPKYVPPLILPKSFNYRVQLNC